jgi:hypothetical protein
VPAKTGGAPAASSVLLMFSVPSVLKGFEVSLLHENPQDLSIQRKQRKEEEEFLDGF